MQRLTQYLIIALGTYVHVVLGQNDFAVLSSVPVNGATSVALQGSVSFTFSAPLDTSWRFGDHQLPIGFIAADPGDSVQVDSVRLSSDFRTITLYVQHSANTDFVWIVSAANSMDGSMLSTPYVLNYTTATSSGTQSVSGTVTLPATYQELSNKIVVGLLDNPVFSQGDINVRRAALAAGNGTYSVSGVRDGIYWPTAAVDVDHDGDIEDFGFVDLIGFYDPNADGIPDSVVVSGNNPTGINIAFPELTLTTARNVKPRADNVAGRFANDQQLKFVGTIPVDSTGKSIFWIYGYYSPTLQTGTYVFATTAFAFGDTGIVGSPGGQSSRITEMSKRKWSASPKQPTSFVSSSLRRTVEDSLAFPLANMLTIPSNFVDSDSAVAVAERNGGRTFRNQYQSTLGMIFGGNFKWVYAADTTKIFWVVEYSAYANDTSYVRFIALVDMTNGQVLNAGTTDVPNIVAGSPLSYQLFQNYPNPFNPETVISFELPQKQFVTLTVYNILGQEVAQLVNSERSAGHHTVRWDGKDLLGRQVATGFYLYRIKAGEFEQTKKMLLVR